MSAMRKLFAGLAATATLLGGMAIGASANAADTYTVQAANDNHDWFAPLSVTSTQDTADAVNGHTFKAIRFGTYISGTGYNCSGPTSCNTELSDIKVGTDPKSSPTTSVKMIDTLDAVLKEVDEDAAKDGIQNGYVGSSYETDKNPAGYIAENYTGYGDDSKDTTSATAPAYAGLLRDFVTKLVANADFQDYVKNGKLANSLDPVYSATGADGVAKFTTPSLGTKPYDGVLQGLYVIVDVTEGNDAHALPMVVGTKFITDPHAYQLTLHNNGYTLGEAIVKTVPVVSQKKVVLGEDGNPVPDGTRASANIGDTVTFRLTGTIPLQPVNNDYYFRDAYGKGIEPQFPTETDASGFVVKVAGVDQPLAYGTDYAITDKVTSQNGLEKSGRFDLHVADPAKYAGKQVTVDYQVKITRNVLYGYNSETGYTIHEMYNRLVAVDESYQTESTVHVYTYSFEFQKLDKDGNPIAGAQFVVKNSEGKYLTNDMKFTDDKSEAKVVTSQVKHDLVTGDTSKVRFDGLKAGTYTVEEIKTADGFADLKPSFTVKLGEPSGNPASPSYRPQFEVTAAQDPFGLVEVSESKDSVTVTNIKSITELPLTGSVGIGLFVVTATVLLGVALFGANRYRSSRRSLRA